VPAEVLAEILLRTAEADVASFARLSRVCRRLAYLVATEEAIWRAICHDPANGFPAMHRQFACAIDGSPLLGADDDEEENTPTSTAAGPTPCLETTLRTLTTTLSALTLTPLYPTYQQMFRTRPRIRFHGAYISTVNYLRPGASSTNQVTWNSPVHIVTYYRYLRFHRDGTAISLLTTSPPLDVIPHLHAANLGTTATGTPAAVMRHALRGRWKLGGGTGADGGRGPEPPPPLPQPESEPEDRLTVETEGPGPKYAYRMQLALRAGGSRAGRVGGAKLAWVGFWSYNRLTDDWAAFGLKNDRAFVWSRVRSWA
jgi:F-box protein 9